MRSEQAFRGRIERAGRRVLRAARRDVQPAGLRAVGGRAPSDDLSRIQRDLYVGRLSARLP